MTHPYTGDQLRDICRKIIVNNPKYMDMKENAEDANSLYFWLDCCGELPGRDGALMRQLRIWLATNASGLLDRIPPPATFERRGREVKKETKDRGLQQPALKQTI